MRFKSLWLFLAAPLGSSLAEFLQHDTQGDLNAGHNEASETDIYIEGGQQPIFEQPQLPHDEEPSTTIYQSLADDRRFSLVTKALNFVDDVASLLNDSSSSLTFFAPPDRVLRRPPGAPPKRNLSREISPQNFESDGSVIFDDFKDLSEVIELINDLDSTDYQDGSDDETRRKFLKMILRAILTYHIIPATYGVEDLGKNITYGTNLSIPSASDSRPLRLRITQTVIPPVTRINFFTKIIRPNLKASNGLIHVIDHALIPPPSIFQQLYMVPRFFSTFTSALQHSNLTGAIDLRFIRGEGLKGSAAVTAFVPTNRAFEVLPKKLQFFLFSPFGERALKKLLQYHIVPDVVVHSNYIYGEVVKPTEPEVMILSDEPEDSELGHFNPWAKKPKYEREHPKPPKPAERVPRLNLTLDTLFENHTLNAIVVQKELTFPKLPGHKKPHVVDTKIFVNHHLAVVSDIVALNGAIHVVDRLLDPRKPHHGAHRPPHRGPSDEPPRAPPRAPERGPKYPWERYTDYGHHVGMPPQPHCGSEHCPECHPFVPGPLPPSRHHREHGCPDGPPPPPGVPDHKRPEEGPDSRRDGPPPHDGPYDHPDPHAPKCGPKHPWENHPGRHDGPPPLLPPPSRDGPARVPKGAWENDPNHKRHDWLPPPPPHGPQDGPMDHDWDPRPPHHRPDHGPEHEHEHEQGWGWAEGHHAPHRESSVQHDDEHSPWADWEDWLPQWAEGTE